MTHTTLIVPGLAGSGPDHWQSWFERELPAARRVADIDWNEPILARWAAAVRGEIDAARGVVWLVAHSYGCLASVVAAVDRPERVAGLLLVAPAEPERFTPFGMRDAGAGEGLGRCIPSSPLGVPSIVVASRNDPWASFARSAHWADCWGSLLIDAGLAGHINVESGYGPWPAGLDILRALQDSYTGLPLGDLAEGKLSHRGRHGALARLRHRTRNDWDQMVAPVR